MELFRIQLLIGDGLDGRWQKSENVNENLGHHDTLCQGEPNWDRLGRGSCVGPGSGRN
jgi:hypothetical protein